MPESKPENRSLVMRRKPESSVRRSQSVQLEEVVTMVAHFRTKNPRRSSSIFLKCALMSVGDKRNNGQLWKNSVVLFGFFSIFSISFSCVGQSTRPNSGGPTKGATGRFSGYFFS